MTSDFSQVLQGGGGGITCTPFSSRPPEEALATAWCDVTDSLYSRLQCPQMTGWGVEGQGWGSSVRLCSRTSGGAGDQRYRQEVKIALASRPSEPWSLVLSRARPWAWVQELFWGLGESHSLEEGPLLPSLPPSLQAVAAVGPCPACRGRKGREGRRGKREGGGRRRRAQGWLSDADSLMSGPVEPLGGPRAQHWEDMERSAWACALGGCPTAPPLLPPSLRVSGPSPTSSPKPPLPCRPPPEAPPMRRPVCSGRSDPEWLNCGSPGGLGGRGGSMWDVVTPGEGTEEGAVWDEEGLGGQVGEEWGWGASGDGVGVRDGCVGCCRAWRW